MKKSIAYIILILWVTSLNAQDSIGVIINTPQAYRGYTLYSPFFSTQTYLIDMNGRELRKWETGFMPGATEYLMPSGGLLKACRIVNHNFRVSGKGGLIQLFDSNGVVQWSYKLIDAEICQHHSILPLPNGNILAILWRRYLKDEAVALGRNPRLAAPEIFMLEIVEIHPEGKNSGEIVWRWKAADHLVQDFDKTKANYGKVSEHPELIDFNYVVRPHNKKDYLHANSLDYDAEKDLILVSVRAMDEIWMIDHGTNTTQAASHKGGRYKRGGDLLFRWGNPKAYKGKGKQTLFGQHDAHFLKTGKYKGDIMIFNNGRDSVRPWSSVDIVSVLMPDTQKAEISTDAKLVWRYEAPVKTDFYSTFLSGAQMLPNGDILITEGQKGRVFEIDEKKNIVWEFITPYEGKGKNAYAARKHKNRRYIFKAKRYDSLR